MKINCLLVFTLLLTFAMGCSSDKEEVIVTPIPTVNGELHLRAAVNSMKTRTIDGVASANDVSDLNSVHVLLLSGEANRQKLHKILDNLNKEEIKKLLNGKYVVSSDENVISGVLITANRALTREFSEGITLDYLKNITTYSSFNKIQPENMEGISNCTLAGVAEILHRVDDDQYNAVLNLVPLEARIQVSGEIAVNDEYVSHLKITRMFIDNFIEDSEFPTGRFTVGTSSGQELDNKLKKYSNIFEINNDGIQILNSKKDKKVYAYHVFPQVQTNEGNIKERGINIILKLEYYNKVLNKQEVKYTTLKLMTSSGISSGSIVDINPGFIYSVDLSRVDWNGDNSFDEDEDKFIPDNGDDTPNAVRKDVAVMTEVEPWNQIAVYPGN